MAEIHYTTSGGAKHVIKGMIPKDAKAFHKKCKDTVDGLGRFQDGVTNTRQFSIWQIPTFWQRLRGYRRFYVEAIDVVTLSIRF